jgi:hypothetical protein
VAGSPTQPSGAPAIGPGPQLGGRVWWRNDETYAGTIVSFPAPWPGYMVIAWDNYPSSLLPEWILGESLLPADSACAWCWQDYGRVSYDVMGQSFCSVECHHKYREALRSAIARRNAEVGGDGDDSVVGKAHH